jgi:hypothetical protein
VLVPLTDNIALVSLTRRIPTSVFLQVAAALQKQVTRDFMPAWGLPATVNAFTDMASVPSDYHVVVLFDDSAELAERLEFAIGPAAAARLIDLFDGDQLAGVHLNEFTRQPFALVEAAGAWTVTLSHEVLEMIADPFGNRLIAASLRGDPARRVNYLVEVCDPCLSTFYPVNGVPVSDFYTPQYFDPVCTEGTRYSFTGEIERPLQILEGGYVTFLDPRDSGLYQLQDGVDEPMLLADITELSSSSTPLRIIVDGSPLTPRVALEAPSLRLARSAAAGAADAVIQASQAAALRTAEAVLSLTAR